MDKDETGPERTCIVTRRKAAPDELIRFALGPELAVVPDIRRKLPGRGVWVSLDQARVAEAVRRHAFARGFKEKVAVGADLPELVGRLLDEDALQSLALANKAGIVTTGFAKIEAALAKGGGVAALVHATDGSPDGIRKLDAAARRRAADGSPPSIKLFASRQLDLALGRTNVIHAALAVGPVSHAVLMRCRRSMLYRSEGPPDTNADAEAVTA